MYKSVKYIEEYPTYGEDDEIESTKIIYRAGFIDISQIAGAMEYKNAYGDIVDNISQVILRSGAILVVDQGINTILRWKKEYDRNNGLLKNN